MTDINYANLCGLINAETNLYEHASAVAYWIVHNAIMESVTELWED